tara:strand:- start:283 stop:471 length:189 start_codon:yes stop_codon:yes gene_type:complete
MAKNFTLKDWEGFLQEREYLEFNNSIKEDPSNQTINNILAHACAVKAVKIDKEGQKVLVFLN